MRLWANLVKSLHLGCRLSCEFESHQAHIMKHIVRYWGCGSNAGTYGWREYDTYEEALAKYKELSKNTSIGDISIS